MEEIDLFSLLYSVKKRWKMIVLLCLVTTLLMGAYSFFIATPLYSSQVKAFIYQEPSSESASSAYQSILTSSYLISDYTELVNSKPVKEQAVNALEAQGYDEKKVVSTINVTAITDTRFIYIEAINQNPEYAAAYANEIAKAFADQATELMQLQNVNIVEEAEAAKNPISPNKKKNIALGFAAGLVLGVVIAVAIDLLDRKVRYPDDLKSKYKQYVLLGAVPDFENAGTQKSKKSLNGYEKGDETAGKEEDDYFVGGEAVEEALKSIRTNILFSGTEGTSRCIALTSSIPGEGKTTTSTNLAIAFAKSGYRTVLVDADLRRPKVHKRFHLKTVKGLTSALVTNGDLSSMIIQDVIENLDVMPAGIRPPNPPELLGSSAMGRLVEYLKDEYDIVIIDTPPVGLFTDAALVSRYCDATVYVVSAGVPTYEELNKGLDELEKIGAKILGFVMTRVERARNGNYYYNYKYKYDYK